MDDVYECVYCGKEWGSYNGTGGDIDCCGERGHVQLQQQQEEELAQQEQA